MSDELDAVAAEVVLGIDVEKFLETDVGRYIMGASEAEGQDAAEAILDIDPYEYETLASLQSCIAKLQQNVHIARKVHGYLSDAIIRASQAEEILQNEE